MKLVTEFPEKRWENGLDKLLEKLCETISRLTEEGEYDFLPVKLYSVQMGNVLIRCVNTVTL